MYWISWIANYLGIGEELKRKTAIYHSLLLCKKFMDIPSSPDLVYAFPGWAWDTFVTRMGKLRTMVGWIGRMSRLGSINRPGHAFVTSIGSLRDVSVVVYQAIRKTLHHLGDSPQSSVDGTLLPCAEID